MYTHIYVGGVGMREFLSMRRTNVKHTVKKNWCENKRETSQKKRVTFECGVANEKKHQKALKY